MINSMMTKSGHQLLFTSRVMKTSFIFLLITFILIFLTVSSSASAASSSSSSSSSSASQLPSSSSSSLINHHHHHQLHLPLQVRTCEPIKIESCKGFGYNVTSMPNFADHELQQDAELQFQTFTPLIQYGCASQLKFFLCSVYVPMCTEKITTNIGPCRPLCENVKARCHPVLMQFGFVWPDSLNCSKFPPENNHKHMCMPGPEPADHERVDQGSSPGSSTNSDSGRMDGIGFPEGGGDTGLSPAVVNRNRKKWKGNINGNNPQMNPNQFKVNRGGGGTRVPKPVASRPLIPPPPPPLPPLPPMVISTSYPINYVPKSRPVSSSSSSSSLSPGSTSSVTNQLCSHLRYSNHHHYINRTSRCVQDCDANILYGAEEKYYVQLWLWIFTCLGFMSSVVTIFIFFLDTKSFKYPERAVVYIGICYLGISVGYFVRLIAGRDEIACTTDPQHNVLILLQEGLDNIGCTVVFVILYFFGTSSVIWWLVVCFCWYLLITGKRSPEEIGQLAGYFHCGAWGLSALTLTAILVQGAVDADELSGTCFVGNQRSDTLAIYVIAQNGLYLLLGTVCLLSGFWPWLCSRRSRLSTDEDHLQEEEVLGSLDPNGGGSSGKSPTIGLPPLVSQFRNRSHGSHPSTYSSIGQTSHNNSSTLQSSSIGSPHLHVNNRHHRHISQTHPTCFAKLGPNGSVMTTTTTSNYNCNFNCGGGSNNNNVSSLVANQFLVKVAIFIGFSMITTAYILVCSVYEYFSRDTWYQAATIDRPYVQIFFLKIFMSIFTGIVSGVWVFSCKEPSLCSRLLNPNLQKKKPLATGSYCVHPPLLINPTVMTTTNKKPSSSSSFRGGNIAATTATTNHRGETIV